MNRRDWFRSLALGSTSLLAARSLPCQTSGLTLVLLTENFHMLMGAGGNITIVNADAETLICDSGLANMANPMLAQAKSIAHGPIRLLIDTHWHADHTGGNVALAAAGAEIIAHTNTMKRVSTAQHMVFFDRLVPALPPMGLPKKTFTDRETMTFGRQTVEIVHHPEAHTDGDTTVFFPKSNVFVAGDLLFNGMYPFIDYSSNGLIEGMIANSAALLHMVDDQTKIVAGHGPLATKRDLQRFHDMLGNVNEALAGQIKQGQSVDQVLAESPTKAYDAVWGNGFLKPEQFVRMLYQGKTQMPGHKAA